MTGVIAATNNSNLVTTKMNMNPSNKNCTAHRCQLNQASENIFNSRGLVVLAVALFAGHAAAYASCGITGTAGTNGAQGGVGGGGSAATVYTTSQGDLTISTTCGGNGGQGGTSSSPTNAGGNGGSGALGVYNSVSSSTINSITINSGETVAGGNGGNAGTGGTSSSGADGGTASSGLKNAGTITTLTNNGTITGGQGGAASAGSTGAGGTGGGTANGVYNFAGTIGTLNNNGQITSGASANGGAGGTAGNGGAAGSSFPALYNSGTITTVNNSGTISGGTAGNGGGATGAGNTGGNGATGNAALLNAGGLIQTLNNTGTITGGAGGSGGATTGANTTGGAGGAGANGIKNETSGQITTLNNSGSITGGNGAAGGSSSGTGGTAGANGTAASAVNNDSTSTITTLINTGTITGSATGTATLGISGVGGNAIGNSGTISTLTNSGTMTGGGVAGVGIRNSGTITTLTNNGTLSGQTAGLYNSGSIGSSASNGLTNYGTIQGGISNTGGTISALNNQQGASGSALSYTGTLPTAYNPIIASTSNYGQLSISAVSGTSAFGISSASTTSTSIINKSFTAVLQGFGNTLSTYLTGLTLTGSTYTGSSSGYSYALTEEGSTGTWDLTITACSVCSANGSTSGTSSSGTSTTPAITNIISGAKATAATLGHSYNPVLAGGTLVLSAGDQISTPILVTSSGGMVQQPTSGNATVSGLFSGVGGLTFTGTGNTLLMGTNTYSGGTTVSGGTLTVAGAAPTGSGDVVVSTPATLMGSGTISGNVIVYGILKPGNSPGYLSVSQSVTLNAGSVYQQDIAGISQASSSSPSGASGYYSFLSVNGQLTINSGTILNPRLQNLFQTTESGYGSAPYVPSLGDTFRIITAATGITGTFSTISQPSGLASGTQFIPFYNYSGSNSVDLAVVPTSYPTTLANNSTNVQAIASVLDKLSAVQVAGTASSTQTNLMYSTATQTAASLPRFAQSLTGEIYADTVAVIPQTSQRVQSAVIAHLSDVAIPLGAGNLNASMPLNTNSVTAQNPLGLTTGAYSTNPAVDPVKDMAGLYKQNIWGEIAYQYGNRSGDSNANGFNSNLYQAVFGADLYQEGASKAGAGFSLSTTNVSMSQGTGTIGQGSIFVYGKAPVLQDYVLSGMASFGLSSTDVSRTDPTSSSNLKARGIRGNDVLLSADISRPIDLNDVVVTPYVRTTWQMVNQSSFDEGNASAAALSVNSYSGNSLRGLLGVSLGSKNKNPMSEPFTYKVNLAVGADTNSLINPTLNTNLAGYGTTVQASNIGNTFVQAALYGTARFTDNAYGFAELSGETRARQTLGGVTVGVRVQF